MDETFGRNRDSVANIKDELHDLFLENPDVAFDPDGTPRIPNSATPDILRRWSEDHGSEDLLSAEELNMFLQLLESQGTEIRPDAILGLFAVRGKDSPHHEQGEFSGDHNDTGRPGDNSRSSSSESRHMPASPTGFASDTPDSPFEAKNRQRSRPLAKESVPSSWNSRRPLPASHGRRKSDAGPGGRALSDSESSPLTTPGRRARSRAPSNPTSPSNESSTLYSPQSHSPFSSRPPSRTQSRNGFHRSLRDEPVNNEASPSLFQSVQSLSQQAAENDDDSGSDSDGYDQTARINRLSTASTSSIANEERVDALQRLNEDLARKLVEAEATLHRKLQDSDEELAGMEERLEEMRQELASKNREEKELRAKDRANVAQIQALESEVSKLQRGLDNSRAAYHGLQKQYQEQCAESERYRNSLRAKDDEVKQMVKIIESHSHEDEKKDQGRLATEIRASQLEEELIAMREAEGNLDLQKAENLLLKETIDRLRFELDEMTNAAAGSTGAGPASHAGTFSRSWGAEVARSMHEQFEAGGLEDEGLEEDHSGDSTEGEEEMQTIITRKRKLRKSAGKSGEIDIQEEVRSYSDASTQHVSAEFSSEKVAQTDNSEREAIWSSGKSAKPDWLGELPLPVLGDELPPSYSPSSGVASTSNDAAQKERAAIALDTLKQWHRSRHSPFEGIPEGISEQTAEDWDALKKEIGIDCIVIDKAIEATPRKPSPSRARRRNPDGRFYNIYNTYIYGDSGFSISGTVPTIIFFGAIALLIATQPFMPTSYSVPGSPNYFDRIGWAAAHSLRPAGDGFEESQTNAAFGIFGRLIMGGAQIAAGRMRPFVPT